jgi:hypothetical protein
MDDTWVTIAEAVQNVLAGLGCTASGSNVVDLAEWKRAHARDLPNSVTGESQAPAHGGDHDSTASNMRKIVAAPTAPATSKSACP